MCPSLSEAAEDGQQDMPSKLFSEDYHLVIPEEAFLPKESTI